MMKTKNIIRIIAGMGLLVSAHIMTSCEKELANVLKNDTYSNAFWKNSSDVEGAINGTYALFRKAMTTNQAYFFWGDLPIGKLITNDNSLHNGIYAGDFTAPYREEGVSNWTNWYRVVDLANLIIKRTPEIPDAEFSPNQKNYLIGQAYFMRALSYFYMTRVWGDLPLQTKPTETADDAEIKGTTSADEILKLVISDAQKASTLMTWESVNQSDRRRANKGAALALLTHATAFQNDYAKSLIYADSLLQESSFFSLQEGGKVRELFNNQHAKENILVFTTKDSENESTANTNNPFTNSTMFVTLSNIQYPGMPTNVPLYFMDSDRLGLLYPDENDLRRTDFFSRFDSGPVTQNNNQISDRYSLIKYANFVYKNPATQDDLRGESNLIIFRLADIILLKAEALHYLNRDSEARSAVNLIRGRSKAEDLNSS